MRIQGLRPGETLAPLETITLTEVGEGGTVEIEDGERQVYARMPAQPEMQIMLAGALGNHAITHHDDDGQPFERIIVCVEAETQINDTSGQFHDLLNMLYYTMAETDSRELRHIRHDGRIYRFFIRWLRDHVHVLKGMKYFSTHLKDGIDLYRHSQREDGMIWDNVDVRDPASNAANHWSRRFDYDDFIRVTDNGTVEFKRIPVENDVEYLFVEGLYFTWKASGDDGWMADSLDAAIRALDYSTSSPYRWSIKFGLLKRGFTIDTWDFQGEADSVNGDPMTVDKDKTRFGVMFGDNTGYIMACGYLAEMLQRAGRVDEAKKFRKRAAEMRERLETVSWNGRFFVHHVPEDDMIQRNLGVDETEQVSLSNAYSLNRGLDRDHAAAIIRTYMSIRDHLPEGSPGEWYTIYPPFPRGFEQHSPMWQYMNGGVTPIVAGELAHGAFMHGFEDYGVDVLRRILELGQRHGGRFYSVYTGAIPESPTRSFITLDIAEWANIDLAGQETDTGVVGWTGETQTALLDIPHGWRNIAGIPYQMPDRINYPGHGALGIGYGDELFREVELPINGKAESIYLLHTAYNTGDGVGGRVIINYTDGSTACHYIVEGRSVLPWTTWQYPQAPDGHSVVGWRGWDDTLLNVTLLNYGFNNPFPDLEIADITLEAAESGGLWGVLGVTISDYPVYFPPGPISYGVPNGWSAAAVVYALIEGLAGAVDADTAYRRVTLSPRWTAADLSRVSVVSHYPESGGYVAYRFRHDIAGKAIYLDITGSGRTCDCHVLLPGGVTVKAVYCNGDAIPFEAVTVGGSHYADFGLSLPGPHLVGIRYG